MGEQFLVYRGEHFDVEFYYNENGEIKAWDFFSQLSENEVAAFFARVEKLANAFPGTLHPKTIFNLEDARNKIWAIKFGHNRFCTFFYEGGKIIITNGYSKQTQKNGKRELEHIKKAIAYKEDYEVRVQKQKYYEEERQ